ncbi:ABC transporter substrate-binding protein [Kitasatospora sp. NPDC006697]|uniref:ABC transporter substrate-binding protein n=1 Tax=Kitasatospora sp. NPDC006697 TaxID=3364020 RepID=UPI0036B41908
MPGFRSRLIRSLSAGVAGAALAIGVTACGSSGSTAAGSSGGASGDSVTVGALANGAATQTDLTVPEVADIRAELPASVVKSGQLVIGVGALPAGFAPLAYVGSDQKTLTGAEPDLGRLVAAVLGLRPVLQNATWENMFVGLDSGKTDVLFSNVTDTEERKKKYDFASYRQDNLAFEVLKSSTWSFGGDYHSLAGKTVAVSSGTNQEKILLEWQSKLKAEGKQLTISYYPDPNAIYLALTSGRIDASFGPNPGIAYQITQKAGSPDPVRNAGTYSGAGESLQGLIAATAKKDSGLAKPVADALNHLIQDGQYAKWLAAWNLANEAVPSSQINPPGLPLSNS